MARKPTQPAMYELLRPTSQQRPVSSPTTSGPGSGAASSGGSAVGGFGGGYGGGPIPPDMSGASPAGSQGATGPGRFVRIPVGYAYVALAIALAAIVCVYIYGFSAGESSSAKRFEQRRIEELDAQASLPAYDPLNAGKRPASLTNERPGTAPGTEGVRGGNGAASDSNRSGVNGGAATPAGQDLGPAPGGDPRQPGLNYFVLAHVAARNGEPIVDFCRKNGLDAHLVPDDNGELRLVIVCPGFSGGERQSVPVKALESKIRSVGLKWKSAARGNRDFGDLYPKKHKSA